jgi:hypothetical protein
MKSLLQIKNFYIFTDDPFVDNEVKTKHAKSPSDFFDFKKLLGMNRIDVVVQRSGSFILRLDVWLIFHERNSKANVKTSS